MPPSSHLGALGRRSAFLVVLGVVMLLLSAPVGLASGFGLGRSVGGWTLLALLAASADDIAVPAAMRLTVPEAKPALSVTEGPRLAARSNSLVGVPLCYEPAQPTTAATP